MLNLIAFFVFSQAWTAQPALAQVTPELPPLLSAYQHSGFVRPENRFMIECTLKDNGQLYSKIMTVNEAGEWGAHQIIERKISDPDLALVSSLIQEARSGPYQYGTNPCDIGGLAITARVGNAELALEVSPDCGHRIINLSNAGKQLVDWMKKSCNLRIWPRSSMDNRF
jgi:hypothetical protein